MALNLDSCIFVIFPRGCPQHPRSNQLSLCDYSEPISWILSAAQLKLIIYHLNITVRWTCQLVVCLRAPWPYGSWDSFHYVSVSPCHGQNPEPSSVLHCFPLGWCDERSDFCRCLFYIYCILFSCISDCSFVKTALPTALKFNWTYFIDNTDIMMQNPFIFQ